MNTLRILIRKIPGTIFLYRKIKGMQDRLKPTEEVFTRIYQGNRWGGEHSVSGPGSDPEQTRALVAKLPAFLRQHGIHSMLDIPCGDFQWMQHVDLQGIEYLGGDIVEHIIAHNQSKYTSDKVQFRKINLLADPLPKVDLILCRDCLVHFSYSDIRKALRNINASGSQYLLTTTFIQRQRNRNIFTGEWRPLNLRKAPLRFPEPLALLDEECIEDNGKYRDKMLGLWKVADLPREFQPSR